MLKFLRLCLDLLLHSHLWIAIAALLMCWQTQLILLGAPRWGLWPGFVFFATIWLYALHRIVVCYKSSAPMRFSLRLQYGLMAISGLVALLLLLQLSWPIWFFLLPAALIALAYVLPLFGKGKRLRDFPYIKVVMIVLAWSWITVVIPALEAGMTYHWPTLLLLPERMAFVFAIALAFDIRDEGVDLSGGVRTLPGLLGWRRARSLAMCSLLLAAIPAWLNYRLSAYSSGSLLGLYLSLAVSLIIIRRVHPRQSPTYFAFWVDGLMIIQFGLVWWGSRLG